MCNLGTKVTESVRDITMSVHVVTEFVRVRALGLAASINFMEQRGVNDPLQITEDYAMQAWCMTIADAWDWTLLFKLHL